jgi:hypothetical protein
MNSRKGLWMALPAIALFLTGCYDEPKATFFEPGEYQGRPDPLVSLEASAQQQQKLQERLKTVQMDR